MRKYPGFITVTCNVASSLFRELEIDEVKSLDPVNLRKVNKMRIRIIFMVSSGSRMRYKGCSWSRWNPSGFGDLKKDPDSSQGFMVLHCIEIIDFYHPGFTKIQRRLKVVSTVPVEPFVVLPEAS